MIRIFSILIAVLFLSVAHTSFSQSDDGRTITVEERNGFLERREAALKSAIDGLRVGDGYEAFEAAAMYGQIGDYYGVRDDSIAFQLYLKSAEVGEFLSYWYVGFYYKYGMGTEENTGEAIRWLYKCATHEYYSDKGRCPHDLGDIYWYDYDDKKTGSDWYLEAAERGFEDSQQKIGLAYEYGQGVVQDFVSAHMWFNIAASNGAERASGRRDTVEQKMTRDQISKAQELARECERKEYKNC